jgi:uncharacterized protein Usg
MIGASWGAWRDRVQRRVSFIEKQLTYLYAPLFALRTEISAMSQTREFFRDLGQRGWEEVTKATEGQDPAAKQRVTKEWWPAYQRLLEFDDRKLLEVLLPAYRKMLSVFRDHLWLADFDTRDYYPQLIGFVSTWERYLEGALPPEVIRRISISEAQLQPFYDHIAARHDALRARLQRTR